jgi:hypothetical protein
LLTKDEARRFAPNIGQAAGGADEELKIHAEDWQ